MQPIQMTRAEYEAKYGAQVPVATSTPVKMTRAEYDAKYGTEALKEPGFVQSVAQGLTNAPLKMLSNYRNIASSAKSAKSSYDNYVSLKGDVGVTGVDDLYRDLKNKTYNTKAELDQAYATPAEKKNYDYGYLGNVTNITTPKEAAGVALDAASNLVGGTVVKTGTKTLGTSLFKRSLPKVMDVAKNITLPSIVGGTAYGAGQGLQQDKTASEIGIEALKNGAVAGVAGTIFGVGSPFVGKGLGNLTNKAISRVTQTAEEKALNNFNNIVQKRSDAIAQVEGNYVATRKANSFKKDAGAQSRERIAKTDILVNAIDGDGTIRTVGKNGPVEKYRAMTLDNTENLVRKNLENLGETVNIQVVESNMTANIAKSGLEGSDLTAAIGKIKKELYGLSLRADENGNIPLVALQDAKVSQYKNINYLTAPEVNTYRKSVAKSLKETIEQNSKFDVKPVNEEISKYLEDIKLLERLDGKKVKGGKLGGYFAQISGNIIGSAAGSVLGPVGSAAGAVIGGEVTGAIKTRAMSKVFGKATNYIPKKSQIIESAKKTASLPSDYSYNPGSLNTKYATTKIKNRNIINTPTLPQVKSVSRDLENVTVDNLSAKDNQVLNKWIFNKAEPRIEAAVGDVKSKIEKAKLNLEISRDARIPEAIKALSKYESKTGSYKGMLRFEDSELLTKGGKKNNSLNKDRTKSEFEKGYDDILGRWYSEYFGNAEGKSAEEIIAVYNKVKESYKTNLSQITNLQKQKVTTKKQLPGMVKSKILPPLAAVSALAYGTTKLPTNNMTYNRDKSKDKLGINIEKATSSLKYNETRGEKEPYTYSRFSGDEKLGRALGAYQVTEGELKTYSERFLNKKVTPEEFLSNSKLQDDYVKSKIKWLESKGLTLEEIFAAHRGGFGDFGKKKDKVKQYDQYVKDAVEQYRK